MIPNIYLDSFLIKEDSAEIQSTVSNKLCRLFSTPSFETRKLCEPLDQTLAFSFMLCAIVVGRLTRYVNIFELRERVLRKHDRRRTHCALNGNRTNVT